MFLVMEEMTEQLKLTSISGGVPPYSTDWFGIDTISFICWKLFLSSIR